MPPQSFPAVPRDADACEAPTSSPRGITFIDRAREMVAFLAARGGDAVTTAPRPEQDLNEWITRWRGMPVPGLDATQHFVAEELGIIARALNGPAQSTRLRPQRTDEMCWLIARCISRAP